MSNHKFLWYKEEFFAVTVIVAHAEYVNATFR